MPGQPDQTVFIFFGVWIVLGALSAALFLRGKNARLKRRLWPPFIVPAGTVFAGFSWTMGFPLHAKIAATFAVAFIAFMNIRTTRFCDACGALVNSPNLRSSAVTCTQCGAELRQ